MRSSWINSVGPKSMMRVLIRREDSDTQKEECEDRSRDSSCHKPRNASSLQKLKKQARILPEGLERECGPADTFISNFWP